jgi:hypothetical protein
MSTVNASTPYEITAVYMAMFGTAIGLFSSPNMSSVMMAVPPDRRGIGSAVRSTFLNVGMAFSLNLAILIISFTVPYALITQTMSGYTSVLDSDKALFLQGLQSAYLWLAGLNALAIIPSVLRGKGQLKTKMTELSTDLDATL